MYNYFTDVSRKFEWTSTANNLCSIYTRLTISDSYYLTLGVWFCPIRNTDTPNVFRNPKRNEIVSPIFQKFPPHVLRSKAIATTSSFPSYILSSHTFCLRCAVVAALSCYSSWRWTQRERAAMWWPILGNSRAAGSRRCGADALLPACWNIRNNRNIKD